MPGDPAGEDLPDTLSRDAVPDGMTATDGGMDLPDAGSDAANDLDTGGGSDLEAPGDPGTATDPGTTPDPGDDPGVDPGVDPGHDPGLDPGFDPGDDPGADPGLDPGVCTPVPVPEPVPLVPLPAVSPPGRTESTRANGFNDDYLYSSNGDFKVGSRRDWGATMVFLGFKSADDRPGVNNTNVIDGNDTGREVQVAFYDPARAMQGCAHNASCQTNPAAACPNSIRYLGWNPVQGGNRCNKGSGVEWARLENGTLEASVRPYQWNPDWDRIDCSGDGCTDPALSRRVSDVRYTQRLRWVGSHVVEMQMQVDNLAAIDHGATGQEFPTLYASWGQDGTQDLRVILDSAGNQVPIDIPANDGFFYKNFDSAGGWVALQNTAQNYGVGIYYENRLTTFQGWQKVDVFNNVRSRFTFAIPANGTVIARAYLMLGSFDTIRGLATDLDRRLAPFGVLDEPAADDVLSGSFHFHGWILDNKGVSKVRVLLDGTAIATPSLDQSRTDVCRVYPGYARCPMVGYAGTASLAGVSHCPHLLEVEATDTDGNVRVIARRRVRVQ